jgi:hypothetical protein
MLGLLRVVVVVELTAYTLSPLKTVALVGVHQAEPLLLILKEWVAHRLVGVPTVVLPYKVGRVQPLPTAGKVVVVASLVGAVGVLTQQVVAVQAMSAVAIRP